MVMSSEHVSLCTQVLGIQVRCVRTAQPAERMNQSMVAVDVSVQVSVDVSVQASAGCWHSWGPGA
jgi:hypothetical protein